MFTGFNNDDSNEALAIPRQVDGESATTILFGEKTRQHPDGVTCDFTASASDHFDSNLGRVSFDDRQSLGSCWEVIEHYNISRFKRKLFSFPSMLSCLRAAL